MTDLILIVDDNKNLREDLKKYVKQAVREAIIFEAADKNDAFNLINQMVFSVIATDVNLGKSEQSGFDLLMVAKKRCEDTQVIVFTSYADPEHISAVQKYDAFDYLNRTDSIVPFEKQFPRKVNQALDFFKYKKQQGKKSELTFTVPKNGMQPSVRTLGGTTSISENPLQFNSDQLKILSSAIGSLKQLDQGIKDHQNFKQSNALSKFIGQHLWKLIFADHPVLLSQYWESLGKTIGNENLTIRFEIERDYLDIPFELLNDNIFQLGLKHPIVYSFLNIAGKRRNNFTNVFEQFDNKATRILLIAANVFSFDSGLYSIPGTDKEVRAI